MTLEQVITQCRDHIVSPYLVHYTHNTAMARRGGMVKPNTISTSFKKIRELSGLSWSKGTPPSFHEIRSLAERLYREQKSILGIYLGIKASVKPIDTTMIEEKNGELLEREFGHFHTVLQKSFAEVLQKIF